MLKQDSQKKVEVKGRRNEEQNTRDKVHQYCVENDPKLDKYITELDGVHDCQTILLLTKCGRAFLEGKFFRLRVAVSS